MYRFFLLLFVLILTSCQTQMLVMGRAPIPVDSFTYVEATLHIEVCTESSGMSVCVRDSFKSSGSGISIGTFKGHGSLVLTAGHVCEIDKNTLPKDLAKHHLTFRIFDRYGRPYEAKVINTNYKSPDICALFVKGAAIKGVKVSKQKPKIGDRVYSMSAPQGIFHPPAVPILEGTYSGDVYKERFTVTTIRAIGGCSGSGILNQSGELVGILFATHPAFNSVTLSSTYSATINFIHETFEKIGIKE